MLSDHNVPGATPGGRNTVTDQQDPVLTFMELIVRGNEDLKEDFLDKYIIKQLRRNQHRGARLTWCD